MYTLVIIILFEVQNSSIYPKKSPFAVPSQPSGHHRYAFCHKLVLPALGFYINRSVQHVLFCVCLLFPSRMFSRFIHVLPCLSSLCLFIAEFYFFCSGLYFFFSPSALVHWPETVYCVTLEKNGREMLFLPCS